MPQLDPTWFASQLFWLAVGFVLLYTLMAKLVLPPLQAILARRMESISGDLEKADSMKKQAEQERIAYERTRHTSQEQAQQSITSVLAEQKAKAEADGKAMDAKVEKMLAEASTRITSKKNELIAGLAPTTSDLTALIVEKLVSNKPSSEQVSQVLAELSKGRLS